MSTDIAKLVFEFDSSQAVQARKNLDDLTKSAEKVEAVSRKVRTASEQAGIGVGNASTASDRASRAAAQHAQALANAERVMRGSLHTQTEATAMLLRNATARDALAKQTVSAANEEAAAAKRAANATIKAEQERTAAWKQSQSVQAEIMRERVSLARQAEREEAAAAKTTADYAAKVDRLRATLDPFAAVQTTLAQRTKLLDDALRAGAITADQHAATLSKVTRVALDGAQGISKYSGSLKNGGQYATQFSYQLNDIATGLMSGQKPMQVLAQQGGQLFQIFQMAALEAGGFRAAIKAMYLEIVPLLTAFAPWIAGLLAVGAAIAFVAKAHSDHMKRIDAVNKSIDEMQKKLADTVPWLDKFALSEGLARDGSAALISYLEKKAKGMADYAANTREATLALLNQQSVEAASNAQKLRTENLKTNSRGATIYVGKGSLFSGTDSKGYKEYVKAQEKADRIAEAAQKLLTEGMKAPNSAFVSGSSARTPRDMTDERASQLSKDIETAKAAELQAQMALTADVEARAAFNRRIIQAESAARQAELAGKIAAVADDKGLSDAKKNELTAGYEALKATEQRIAGLKAQAVDQELASQLLQAELTSRQAASAYLDKMAGYAAERAATDAERNAIELASLKRRQDEEAYALAASSALKVSTGEISAMAATDAELRQRNVSIAEEESVLRKQSIEAARREVEMRQAQLQSDIDLLQSRQGLARSSYEAAQLQKQINEARFQSDKAGLDAVALANGYTAEQVRAAKDRLETLKLIHANEQKQIDLSDNMVTAMSSAIRAVDDMARAFKSGDIGGGISALSGALKQASGLLGSSSGLGKSLGGIADFLGPIGGAVSAVSGLFGGLFGSSKAKKQAKAQAAAQKAAEEAQRQQTIADTEFALSVALLRAQGQEQAAVNMERDREIARLTGISQASADLQKQLWALDDAATASAKAAEEAAAAAQKAAAIEARRSSIQDEIDKLTMSSAELLAKARERERAEAVALDPTLGDLIDKLYAAQDATASQAAATQMAASASEAATSAAERQAQAMQSLGDSFQNALRNAEELSKSLQSFADSLLNELGLGGQKQAYAASRSAFLASAQSGNFDQGLAQAFLDSSKANSTSSAAYQSDVALVRALALGKVSELNAYPDSLRRLFQAIQADAQAKASGTPGYATGGAMRINGVGGVDQNVLSLNGSPIARVSDGEHLYFNPPGKTANDNIGTGLAQEVRALREEVARLRVSSDDTAKSNDKIETYLRNVTEGGRVMLTEAAS